MVDGATKDVEYDAARLRPRQKAIVPPANIEIIVAPQIIIAKPKITRAPKAAGVLSSAVPGVVPPAGSTATALLPGGIKRAAMGPPAVRGDTQESSQYFELLRQLAILTKERDDAVALNALITAEYSRSWPNTSSHWRCYHSD